MSIGIYGKISKQNKTQTLENSVDVWGLTGTSHGLDRSKKTAEENQQLYPEAAKVNSIKVNSYMDDLCDSLNTIKRAQKPAEDIDKILETLGFRVKELVSNKTLNEGDSKQEMAIQMLKGDGKEKVLGLEWKPKADKFSFKMKVDLSNIKNEEDH